MKKGFENFDFRQKSGYADLIFTFYEILKTYEKESDSGFKLDQFCLQINNMSIKSSEIAHMHLEMHVNSRKKK